MFENFVSKIINTLIRTIRQRSLDRDKNIFKINNHPVRRTRRKLKQILLNDSTSGDIVFSEKYTSRWIDHNNYRTRPSHQTLVYGSSKTYPAI